jgi:tryptophanyl-tRNA synthetase
MEKELYHRCAKAEIGCTECKKRLAQELEKVLAPIRQKRTELAKHKSNVLDILMQGAKKAKKVAGETLAEVKDLIGLY